MNDTAKQDGAGPVRPTVDLQELDGFLLRVLIGVCSLACRALAALVRPFLGRRQRILLIRLDGIGDLALTSPLLRELRRALPQAHLGALFPDRTGDLFHACPHLDQLCLFDTLLQRRRFRLLRLVGRAFWFRLRNLRALTADIVIAPRHTDLVKHEILFLLLGCAPRRIAHWSAVKGWARRFPRASTEALTQPQQRHVVEYGLDFVWYLGGAVESHELELWPRPADHEYADRLFARLHGQPADRSEHEALASGAAPPGMVVALMPGASNPGRQWPPKRYGEVARWLIDTYGARVLVLGGPGDRQRAERVAHYARRDHCVSIAGECGLSATAAILKKCALYVGADTGCMHLAAAAGCPVVELTIYTHASHSPVSAVYYAPWQVPCRIVRPPHCLPPCRTECLVQPVPHCIMLISTGMVMQAVQALLLAAEGNQFPAAGGGEAKSGE